MSNFVEECKTDFVVDEEGGYGEQNLTFPSSRYPLFLVSGQAALSSSSGRVQRDTEEQGRGP